VIEFGADNARPRALFSPAALGPFAALDAPVTMNISVGLDRQAGVNRFEGDVTIGGGSADVGDERFDLSGGRLHGRYDVESDELIIDQISLAGDRTRVGGDIRVLGPRGDGSPWRFGIAHPRAADATIASVEMTGGALATSGDYERYFEHEGRRYCHILDPRSGWPVSTWASISVTAPACLAAGALSTIAMLKGEQALAFLATRDASFLALDTQLRTFSHGLGQSPSSQPLGATS
ncbi:MAG TPA: FAD:protein FMN transferase, partial [Burkholderiaceae bacterium]|nr:FAD:protein FMN transferase [Burkholderiaceae bacterium]